VHLKPFTKIACAAVVMVTCASVFSDVARAYDPRAMTGPGFLALASGRMISGWLSNGNRAFYLRVEKGKVYSLKVPAQNGFPEVHETGTVRPTKEHYCLSPYGGAKERCLRVRLLEDNEFESTDDSGKRIARWWLAQQ
jgi:hypothetical protein